MRFSNLTRQYLTGFSALALILWAGATYAANAADNAEKDLKLRLVSPGAAGKKAPAARQRLQLDCPFGDRMVLQSGRKISISGSAEPSCPVELTFAGRQLKTTSDAAGKWQVTLEPLEVSKKPLQMQIKAGNDQQLINDILVGEVWLISGQSNMSSSGRSKLGEYKSRAQFFGDQVPALRARVEKIAEYNDPEIRFVRISPAGSVTWKKCVRKDALSFSLVGMYFARKLHQALDVPVGIIDTANGCASIEAYLPEEELVKSGSKEQLADGKAYRDILKRGGFGKLDPAERARLMKEHCLRWAFCKKLIGPDGTVDPKHFRSIGWHMSVVRPMAAYDSTVARIIDFPSRGMLWYQGETNLREKDYHLKQTLLAEGMRRVTKNPDMAFYAVLIAPYMGYVMLPEFWPQQYIAAADTPNSALVNTVDTPPLEQRDYHPTSKDFVGERLALAALNKTYGKKDIAYSSPIFDKAEPSGSSLLISFRHGKGLHTADGKAPSCFQIAGEDKKFVPATAVIEGDKIRLSAAGVPNPKYARYAWSKTNNGINLFNGAGLPPFPFDSSDPFFQSEKLKKMHE